MWPTHWPSVARDIADAVEAGVDAARNSDAAGLAVAAAELAALPREQVESVSAAIVRELLETVHPDGLTGEDVQQVLGRCAREAAVWLPGVDVDALVFVLTGALGVADTEEIAHRPNRSVEAAILVAADLAGAAQVAVHAYVRRALDEIARAETIEIP